MTCFAAKDQAQKAKFGLVEQHSEQKRRQVIDTEYEPSRCNSPLQY
jgi:hypothetical protein